MLTRYNAWSNKLIFDAVAAPTARQPDEKPVQEQVHTLNHNYVIDLIWQAHRGREHGYTARNTSVIRHWPNCSACSRPSTTGHIAWSDGYRTPRWRRK